MHSLYCWTLCCKKWMKGVFNDSSMTRILVGYQNVYKLYVCMSEWLKLKQVWNKQSYCVCMTAELMNFCDWIRILIQYIQLQGWTHKGMTFVQIYNFGAELFNQIQSHERERDELACLYFASHTVEPFRQPFTIHCMVKNLTYSISVQIRLYKLLLSNKNCAQWNIRISGGNFL